MGRRNIIEQEKEKSNPMLPLLGFIVFLIVGGLAFYLSPGMVRWLETTTFMLGGFIPVLPIEFPKGWPPIANQLVVTLFLFVLLFTIVMSALSFFMKAPGTGDTDVSLDEIRKETKKMRKGR